MTIKIEHTRLPKARVNIMLSASIRKQADEYRATMGLSRSELVEKALLWKMAEGTPDRSGGN